MYRLRAKVEIFLTHTMGIGRGADSRPSVSLRRGGESPPFDTDMRSEGGAAMGLKQARKSCGGVEGKLRSTMPILSSTCEDLKTTCRDDRIYVPGSKIHVRSQRNRRSASGEVLAAHERRAVLLRTFSSTPSGAPLYNSLGGGCMALSSHRYGRAICRRGVRGQWHRVVFVSL